MVAVTAVDPFGGLVPPYAQGSDVKGSTTPRVFTAPLVTGPPGPCGCGCALTPATSRGFELVAFAEILGITLDPWQRWLFIHALELWETPPAEWHPRYGPPFRYRTVLVLVARQNGKTTWSEIRRLWKMLVLELPLMVGMAQDLTTVEQGIERSYNLLTRDPEATLERFGIEHEDLRDEAGKLTKTNGKWAWQAANGCCWRVYAPTSGGGRGASADDIDMDELREHRDFKAWSAISKTMMAKPYGQLFATSNAGDDRSIVLNVLHATARGAVKDPQRDLTLGLFEWSVPDTTKCTCGRRDPDPLDPEDVPDPHAADCMLNDPRLAAMANPSMGYGRHTWQAVRSALNTDPVNVFLTEVYCKRVPNLAPEWQVITEAQWRARADARDPAPRPVDPAFAAQVSDDRKRTVIAAAGRHPDRPGFLVAVVENREGTLWAPHRLADLRAKWNPCAVALQDKGPTGALEAAVIEAGIAKPVDDKRPKRGELITPWASDVADAFGQFIDGIASVTALPEEMVWHLDDGPLTAALTLASTRPVGGAKTWDTAKIPGGEILLAVTLALWAHRVRAPLVISTYDPLGNIG